MSWSEQTVRLTLLEYIFIVGCLGLLLGFVVALSIEVNYLKWKVKWGFIHHTEEDVVRVYKTR